MGFIARLVYSQRVLGAAHFVTHIALSSVFLEGVLGPKYLGLSFFGGCPWGGCFFCSRKPHSEATDFGGSPSKKKENRTTHTPFFVQATIRKPLILEGPMGVFPTRDLDTGQAHSDFRKLSIAIALAGGSKARPGARR